MVFQVAVTLNDNWKRETALHRLQLKEQRDYEAKRQTARRTHRSSGDYPEAVSADRFFPDGPLQSFQRSRLRFWTNLH